MNVKNNLNQYILDRLIFSINKFFCKSRNCLYYRMRKHVTYFIKHILSLVILLKYCNFEIVTPFVLKNFLHTYIKFY